MFERSEPVLRILCAALAAVLVFQVVRVALRHNPVERMKIPDLPALAVKTNTTTEAKGTNAAVAKTKAGSNSVAGKPGTNEAPETAATNKLKDTNAASVVAGGKPGTNIAVVVEPEKTGTNLAEGSRRKAERQTPIEAEKKGTNVAASKGEEKKGTNGISSGDFGRMGTNVVLGGSTNTNGTNVIAGKAPAKGGTNSMPDKMAMRKRGPGFGPGQMGGEKLPDLPPLMQARIDKIVQSEIMAQLMKPQPSGLIGIAGKGAMLRAASGQSGFVKEGGELGGLKLLSVGINRVLVEEDGEKKELMIFSGIGGETLLPKQGETNDTITKTP